MTLRDRFTYGRAFFFSSCALASLTACAGGSTLPPAAPLVASPPPKPPPPDITAVPAPQNLIAFARISRLDATMKVATGWAHLPALDASAFLEGILESSKESRSKAFLMSVVDTTQPIDFAATIVPKLGEPPLGVASLAVKNIDAAKTALAVAYDLTPGDNGVLRLEARANHPPAGKKTDAADGDQPCELAPSAGGSAYRLLCGSSHDALSALGPYLSRTTPRQSFPADVHLEWHAQPVKALASVGRMQIPAILSAILGLNSATDPATVELIAAVVGDFSDYMADLNAMTFDMSLDPAHGLVASHMGFKSTTSLMARMATEHPERADVPPSAFMHLPSDVDMAFFGSRIDDADLVHPRELLVAAAHEQLEKAKLSEASTRALTELLGECIRGAGGMVMHGADGATPYWLIESDEASTQTEKIVRDVLAAFGRADVAKWMKSGVPASAKPPTFKLAAPFAGLPKASLHLAVTVYPDIAPAASKTKPLKAGAAPTAPQLYHLVVAPDGPRSWFAFSPSEPLLRTKLAAVLGTTPPVASSSMAGLAAFKETRMTSGGFLTLRSLIEMAREMMSGLTVGTHVTWDGLLSGLPAKGLTPMTYTSTPSAPTAEDPGGSREMNWTWPADAIRDAIWLGVQLKGP